jgi:heat shock protein HslJ
MAYVSEKVFYWLPAVVIAVAACATGTRPPAGDLTGVEWRLTEIDGAPAVTSAGGGGGDASFRLDADSARVTGFTTCNRFFGRYEALPGGRLRFSNLGSTKMACVEPARSQQEQKFMSVLQSADRYEIGGNVLTLYAGDRVRARFMGGGR